MVNWETLADGIRFDAWANRLWLACLIEKGMTDQDKAIFAHVLSAEKVWLLRCQGESVGKMPEVEVTEETIKELNEGWLRVLGELTADPIIDYRRTTGEPMRSLVSDIVFHVVNHGTYHRGELRGLCLARGDSHFPETDRIVYSLLTRP